jgi:Type II secretion system (T2SS), protein G
MIRKKGCTMDSRHLLISATLAYSAGILLLTASCQTSRIVDTIPPKNVTETRLGITDNRIQNFWNQHGRVPTKPNELPDVKDRDCSLKDGWGRELNWTSDGTSKVKVWSLGRDGKPGGTGEDADMEVVFIGKQKRRDDLPKIGRPDVPP